jgi:uncharacterized membrane protein YfcA
LRARLRRLGVLGAAVGSHIGKAIDGQKLPVLFGMLMITIAALMLLRRGGEGDPSVRLTTASAPELLPRLLIYAERSPVSL